MKLYLQSQKADSCLHLIDLELSLYLSRPTTNTLELEIFRIQVRSGWPITAKANLTRTGAQKSLSTWPIENPTGVDTHRAEMGTRSPRDLWVKQVASEIYRSLCVAVLSIVIVNLCRQANRKATPPDICRQMMVGGKPPQVQDISRSGSHWTCRWFSQNISSSSRASIALRGPTKSFHYGGWIRQILRTSLRFLRCPFSIMTPLSIFLVLLPREARGREGWCWLMGLGRGAGSLGLKRCSYSILIG